MANRDLARIWAYHDGTKHSLASLHGDPHFLDWENMPRPFKVYPELAPLPLPRDFVTSTRPALAAIADPGSAGLDGPPLDLGALARLLYFTAGVLRRKTYPGGEIYFRAAACTGALYHIDFYLVCGPLADLEAGVYHFGPHDFALRRLRPGDHRAAVVAASGGEPAIAAAPAVLAFTTTFWRNAWKYRARAYRHAFWDAGTLLANLLAVAAAVELPVRIVLGFVDDAVSRLLDLDPQREAPLGLVALGCNGAPPPPAPPAPPLGLDTLPLSAHEIDYPAIRDAHAASALATPAEAAAWRGSMARHPTASAPDAGVPLPPFDPDVVRAPIEAVILRRGSTRAFAREPIGLPELTAILSSATRGLPGDWTAPGASVVDPYVLVHAVDGLASGAYALDRTRNTLVPLRTGTFRREAGHLDLGQALAADAAIDIFWLADLRPVLARFGNRGYRAAQLEAAIEAGKSYLAAYALGRGATGLTFFDDDVTAFFSPHAAGKSVLFLMAFGQSPAVRRGAAASST